jgi:2-polyprenyl-6-methoxyphenol hydroxylase-like FAD-dependent oxidoreductase
MPKAEFLELINKSLTSEGLSSPFALPESIRSVTHFVRQNPHAPIPQILDLVTDRFLFPLQLKQADSYVGNRLALLGDAAHYMHPQAGQGLNLGIADAIELADCLKNSYGQDLGSIYLLQDYQKLAQKRNALMLAGVHAIHNAFNVDSTGPIAAARNFILDLINASPDAKTALSKIAMGEYK